MISLFFLPCHSFIPIVSLPLSPAGTSNQIGWIGKGPAVMGPCVAKLIEERDRRREFIATTSPPLFLVILGRNRREEERAMSAALRRYNNRKKTNRPETPKPFHNLGYGGRPSEQVTGLVYVCMCACMEGSPLALMGNRWCLIIGQDRPCSTHS